MRREGARGRRAREEGVAATRGALLLALTATAGVGVVASCAREGRPPGGPPDRLPPEVVWTRPDTFAEVGADFHDAIRIQFSERISEQPVGAGRLDDAVLVSPQEGRVRVRHRRDGLEVRMEGGFRPGVVYRVTVFPVIQDLFRNTMAAPFEFVFSTGGEYHQNAMAGLVLDRITGNTIDGASVAVRPDWTDSLDLVYVSRTDTSGIFALRYLPPGRYRVEAFQDRDRDGEPDPFETQGERLVILGATDTVLNADVVVLMPDTLPARLARATIQDSVTVTLSFDDYLDPTVSLTGVSVSLAPVPDTTEEGVRLPPPPPATERLLQQHEFAAWRDSVQEVRAREDSIAAAQVDSAAAGGDSAAVAQVDSAAAAARAAEARRAEGAARVPRPGGNIPRPPGQPERALPDGSPLPSQELVLRLAEAWPAGAAYAIRVEGVVNVNGLGGGGGEVVARREVPSDTATVAPDSVAAQADTATLQADTSTAPPDSAALQPDTTTVQPDTTTVPPDTAIVRPDSGAAQADTGVVQRDTGLVEGESVAVRGPPRVRPELR